MDEKHSRKRKWSMGAVVLLVLGVACLGYGLVVFSLQSGTVFFAVWLCLGAILVALAVCVWSGWWAAAPRALTRCIVGVIVCCVLYVGVTWGLCLSAFGMGASAGAEGGGAEVAANHDDGEGAYRTLIVLGAQVRESGPSLVLRFRLDAAAEYLLAHPGTRCIVTGGQGPNEPETEAAAMTRYLVSLGIDPERIIQEDRADNTVQNIRFSMELLEGDYEGVAIVTNNFHLYRAMHIAQKQGLADVGGIAAKSSPFYLPNNLLYESCGILKDLLAGNM